MTGRICGTGSFTPEWVMDNDEIAKLVETSDEWIQERTGVARRHIIGADTTVSMACGAAERALQDAGVSADAVDLILVSTISSNVILPCTACEVQKAIGAVNAACFDINAACAGFVLAYNTAVAYIASGVYQTILIIGSESLSRLVNWRDRGTCILFGDGAGAAVVKACEGTQYIPFMRSDGVKGQALACLNRSVSVDVLGEAKNALRGDAQQQCITGAKGGMEMQLHKEPEGSMLNCTAADYPYYIQMDGQAVFKFAVKRVPEAIREVLEYNSLKKEQITYYIIHQANKRIVDAIAKSLGEPIDKFPMNMKEYGNTSSASIPILLDEMNRAGKFVKGSKIVLAGFGAGLTWCASVLDWN